MTVGARHCLALFRQVVRLHQGDAMRRPYKKGDAVPTEALLRVDGVCKRFGGLLAVDHASFAVEQGRITALIGPNGAGKTTLFSVITGFSPPSAGRIFYAGADITGEPPQKLARRGIARTFQIVQPFAGLTVLENIAVGSYLYHPARTE